MPHHIWTYCPGCDGKEDKKKLTIDHVHQYIGSMGGDAVTVWFIDGQAFSYEGDAEAHLKLILECTTREAEAYIQKLTRAYT